MAQTVGANRRLRQRLPGMLPSAFSGSTDAPHLPSWQRDRACCRRKRLRPPVPRVVRSGPAQPQTHPTFMRLARLRRAFRAPLSKSIWRKQSAGQKLRARLINACYQVLSRRGNRYLARRIERDCSLTAIEFTAGSPIIKINPR
jgi:hypothetical protein